MLSRFTTLGNCCVKVHIVTAGETFGADNVLLSHVSSCAGLQVESTDQQGCSIIILFCPISSRVGSDMETAMKKVSGDKPVILVLMHHTRNPEYSTCGESQCSVYQNLVLVVHVLFHESVKGLLPSSKNSEAVQQIHDKLLQYKCVNLQIHKLRKKTNKKNKKELQHHYQQQNIKAKMGFPPSKRSLKTCVWI
ncbi:SAP domain-containing ribonucleoprotein [Sarotherodon galilaeus]